MSDGGWRTRIRWVVVHPTEPRVLAARRGPVLPEAERPGQVWTGDPEDVLPVLRRLLDADAILLRWLDDDQDASARARRVTLLAAPRTPTALPEGMAWVEPADLAGGGDATLAARVLAELRGGGDGAGLEPWAAPGWFAEAEAWLATSMARLGRPLTGPVRQVRVWELSCLLRAPTAAGDVWLKANVASPLFVNEGVVLRALAGLVGDRVPAPLAVDAERGWMAQADFGGELGWEAPTEEVEEVARTVARMQIETASHLDLLLRAGCHDRRLDRLAAQTEAWLPKIEATGRLPGIDADSWLTEDELAALRDAVPRLTASCAELAGYAIPATIVHGDLHLDNVAQAPGGYMFFDWTDASVAHPFLDLVTIRRGSSSTREAGDDDLRERVRAAYLPEWSSFESPERLARAWELAAPLGALHQAISYRSLVAGLRPPIDWRIAQGPAWWLRQVLAGLPA